MAHIHNKTQFSTQNYVDIVHVSADNFQMLTHLSSLCHVFFKYFILNIVLLLVFIEKITYSCYLLTYLPVHTYIWQWSSG